MTALAKGSHIPKCVLLVRKAGEMLYHLKQPPKWAGGKV